MENHRECPAVAKRPGGVGASRRAVIAGAGIAAGAVTMASARGALASQSGSRQADEADTGKDAANPAESHDVVVVGAGLAGLSAAIRLRELGLDVALVEKTGTAGGNSRVAEGGFVLPPSDDEQGVEAYVKDWMEMSRQRADEQLSRVLASNTWEAFNWFQDIFPMSDPVPYPPFSIITSSVPTTMADAMAAMTDRYAQLDGTLLLNTKLRELVTDEDGAVVGVRVKDKDGVRTIGARRVLLATGGYGGNKGMLELWQGANADEIRTAGFPSNTGDGLSAAVRIGAGVSQIGGLEALDVGACNPQSSSLMSGPSTYYSVSVNRDGVRFCDESIGYCLHGKAIVDQPGATCSVILDQGLVENEATAPLIAWTLGRWQAAGYEPYKADTLEELAEMLGVPSDALVATISEFNAHVDEATHTTSGLAINKAMDAYKIENPPYYGLYDLRPTCYITFGGLKVNEDFRVLEADGDPIDNLYASGEVTGGLFYEDYIGGGGLGSALVTGYVAARSIAEEIA